MSPSSHPDLDHAVQLVSEADAGFARADYPAADVLYSEALALYAIHLAPSHPDAAHCRLGLARVRNTQCRFAEARALAEQALVDFGHSRRDVAAAHYALGEIIANQGDLKQGAEHLARSYDLRHQALGQAHPDTLDSMSLLALFHAAQGSTQLAQALIAQAVQLANRYSGPPVAAIGRVYNRQGWIWMRDPHAYLQARTALDRALAIYERCVGSDHPDYGIALNNLASLLSHHDHWGPALPPLERSLVIHERAYGSQSLFNLMVLGNLANVEKRLNHLDRAYRYAARALVLAVRGAGPRDPQTLASLRHLVSLQADRATAGDAHAMQSAIPFHLCLVALESAAGKPNPQPEMPFSVRLTPEKAAQRLEHLVEQLAQRMEVEANRLARPAAEQAAEEQALSAARDLAAQGDSAQQAEPAQAYTFYQRALAAQEVVLGPSHLDHLPLLEKLARISDDIGHPSAVLALRERILAIYTAELGEDHPETLIALSNLHQRMDYEYGKEAARPLLARLHALRAETAGPDDLLNRLTGGMLDLTGPTSLPQGPSRSERYEAALTNGVSDLGQVLAGLDEVDWHHLHHAYGPADDTPRHLRLLLSEDEAIRNDAWEALGSSIYHQGTIYAATAAAVPFLIRMLDHPGPPGRLEVLDFLANLAEGSSYLAVHARPDGLKVDWNQILAKAGRGDLESETRKELEVVRQVNQAVAQGVPRYLALLDDPDHELRLLALHTLALLRGPEAEIAPQIITRLTRFSDPGLRAAALLTLRSLLDAGPDSIAFFMQYFTPLSEDPRLVFQAAAGVIERTAGSASQAVIDGLLNAWPAAQHPADEPTEPRSYAGLSFGIGARDLYVLASLGPERGAQALARALLLVTSPDDLLDLAGVMLDLLFNVGQIQHKSTASSAPLKEGRRVRQIDYWSPSPQPVRDPISLTAPQLAALTGLLNLPAFWECEHNLLRLYGLPATQVDLRLMIEQR